MMLSREDMEATQAGPPTTNTYVRATLVAIWYNGPLLLLAGGIFVLISFPAGWLLLQGLFVPGLLLGLLTIPAAWLALLGLTRDVKTDIIVMLRASLRYWLWGLGLDAFQIVRNRCHNSR